MIKTTFHDTKQGSVEYRWITVTFDFIQLTSQIIKLEMVTCQFDKIPRWKTRMKITGRVGNLLRWFQLSYGRYFRIKQRFLLQRLFHLKPKLESW